MNIRSHEDFCAEITRRKTELIKRKKMRQRILLSCIPFVICLGLIAAVGMQGIILQPEAESEEDRTNPFQSTALMMIKLPLADNSSPYESELEINSTEDAERLLAFIQTNAEAFLYSSGSDGWYIFTQSPDPITSNAPEASYTPSAVQTTPEAESACETEPTLDWCEEETEMAVEECTQEPGESTAIDPEGLGTADASTGSLADSESHFVSESLGDECETEDVGQSVMDGEETTNNVTVEYLDPKPIISYQFSSAELNQSVENIDLVYVISVKTEEGKTILYALDAVKYAELAEQLGELLKDLEN